MCGDVSPPSPPSPKQQNPNPPRLEQRHPSTCLGGLQQQTRVTIACFYPKHVTRPGEEKHVRVRRNTSPISTMVGDVACANLAVLGFRLHHNLLVPSRCPSGARAPPDGGRVPQLARPAEGGVAPLQAGPRAAPRGGRRPVRVLRAGGPADLAPELVPRQPPAAVQPGGVAGGQRAEIAPGHERVPVEGRLLGGQDRSAPPPLAYNCNFKYK